MTAATQRPSAREVDAAVRWVLSELFATTDRPGVIWRGKPESRLERTFQGRLLSLREAEALPEELRVIRITPGTVVTPLARDYLRRSGVEVRSASGSETEATRRSGEWGFLAEVESGTVDAVRRSLLGGNEPWFELGPSLESAIAWVVSGDARGALVLTDEAALAVYRACQVSGVRAATVGEPGEVLRAVRSIGVNLLAVEPAGKSIALLKQIGAALRRAGGPLAPDWEIEAAAGRVR